TCSTRPSATAVSQLRRIRPHETLQRCNITGRLCHHGSLARRLRYASGMRAWRWDGLGALLGLGIAVFDLFVFSWAGLDVAGLSGEWMGAWTLGSFVVSYGVVGFVSGRLWLARERSRADAAQISEQLRALEKSRMQLAQSEKLAALGQLAAGVAHEVRNPLGVIKASASLVQEGLEPTGDDHRACALIVNEIDRLDGLLGALLPFAKPAQMRLSETALGPVLQQAKRLANELRPELETRVATGSVAVRADADLLTQLVLGLMINAAEAGAGAVDVKVEEDADHVRLTVQDDGPGVPEADRNRVFEPFFTTKDTGTGLGLSMATRIAEAHGGRLALDTSDEGARFTVTLRREGPQSGAEAA
ncbi:MAG: sensor histidine kinase, partial [Sandaracinaceae bacterium]